MKANYMTIIDKKITKKLSREQAFKLIKEKLMTGANEAKIYSQNSDNNPKTLIYDLNNYVPMLNTKNNPAARRQELINRGRINAGFWRN